MVSPSEVIEAAKPLAKQPVQKGKVWGLLLGGSAALFGLTVALERSKVFPAIAKANEAMSISKAAREVCSFVQITCEQSIVAKTVGYCLHDLPASNKSDCCLTMDGRNQGACMRCRGRAV